MIAGLTAVEGVNCFIHSLQLVVKESILSQRSVSDIIAKGRKIVTHFSHSSSACSKLKNIQENLKLPTHKLIQDITTRWNSTFYMLERLYEQRQAVTAYASEYDIPTLAAYEWSLVENILRVLQPFEEITKEASAEKEIISYVIPAVATLKSYLSKRLNDSGVQTLKEELKKSLQVRFLNEGNKRKQNDIFNKKIYVVATFLDPRFKEVFFQTDHKAKEWVIEEIKENELQLQGLSKVIDKSVKPKSLITDERKETHENIWQCFHELIEGTVVDTDNSSPEYEEKQQKTLIRAGASTSSCDDVLFSTSEEESKTIKSKSKLIRAEIEKYLKEPLLDRKANPIQWWRIKGLEYPKLKTLALKYLSAPPSSVTSERLFSAASNIYTENRNRLLPENAAKLIFLLKNMKFLH